MAEDSEHETFQSFYENARKRGLSPKDAVAEARKGMSWEADEPEEGDPCPTCGEPLRWDDAERMVYCLNDWEHC